jgi:hypothetical protein
MKILPVLLALVLLGATSFDACAQTSRPTPTTDEDELGHTGTDTATIGSTVPTDEVGHTGTDAATSGSTDVGHTGTDTRTAPTGPSPWTLSAESSTISSPGSNTITVTLLADAGAGGDYTVPLSSSAAACMVPASIALDGTTGGKASFQVDCAQVARRTTVTITGGTASTSFTLKP